MTDFKGMRRLIAGEAVSNDTFALFVTTIEVAIYAGALYGFCTGSGLGRWLALAVASISVGTLFLIGHDASHRALAKTPWLNVLIAHLVFMPTLHPQAAWIIGHNRRHHGYTNLRGIDYVWTPWSPAEFLGASVIERLLYRFYRTPIGVGFYYPLTIWLPHMWQTDALDRTHDGGKRIVIDRIIALTGFLSIFGACFLLGVTRSHSSSAASIIALAAVIVPLLVYHFLMSIVIFVHHTHPTVRWFSSKESYDPLIAQTQDTIHVIFPKPVELLFHEIFQHTAHHLNPRVPLHRLARAQRALECAPGSLIIRERFSLKYLLMLFDECQLYDYELHQWLKIEHVSPLLGLRTTAQP